MEEEVKTGHEEIEDLREELEKFRLEKERVRAIVGKIGGVPAVQTKVFNIIFTVSIVILLVVSALAGETYRAIMLELTLVALSLKIVFLIHLQSKVNHFQLWITSAIEWRINEMMKIVRTLGQEKLP